MYKIVFFRSFHWFFVRYFAMSKYCDEQILHGAFFILSTGSLFVTFPTTTPALVDYFQRATFPVDLWHALSYILVLW